VYGSAESIRETVVSESAGAASSPAAVSVSGDPVVARVAVTSIPYSSRVRSKSASRWAANAVSRAGRNDSRSGWPAGRGALATRNGRGGSSPNGAGSHHSHWPRCSDRRRLPDGCRLQIGSRESRGECGVDSDAAGHDRRDVVEQQLDVRCLITHTQLAGNCVASVTLQPNDRDCASKSSTIPEETS